MRHAKRMAKIKETVKVCFRNAQFPLLEFIKTTKDCDATKIYHIVSFNIKTIVIYIENVNLKFPCIKQYATCVQFVKGIKLIWSKHDIFCNNATTNKGL